MPQTDVISLLNRLDHQMLRSFPAYSMAVRASSYRGPDEMYDLLRRISSEQRQLADRIAEAIRDRRGIPDPGQFPIEFTAWNDVALPRILERSAELLENTLAEASAIADANPVAPVFHFAKEVVHLTRRHLAQIGEALAMHVGAV